jgi:pyruvate, water dikinase
MSAHPIEDAHDVRRFGGKAAGLARARRGGLPVPHARALSTDVVEDIVAGRAAHVLEQLRAALRGPLAVRSSAVDEDSSAASFAGQHATVLGVQGLVELEQAVREVHASATAPSALAYRARAGIADAPRIAVVVQELVSPVCAGVLFTRDPRDGSKRTFIECAWGLGETIVQGLVMPERWVIEAELVIERDAGHKDVEIVHDGGAARQREVEPARHAAFCLDDALVRELLVLARSADAVFESDAHDIEWAFADGVLWFLQRRPITSRFGSKS